MEKSKRHMKPFYVAAIILCVLGILLSIIVPCMIDFLINPDAASFYFPVLFFYLFIYLSGAGIFLWGDVHIGGELFSYGNVAFFVFVFLLIATIILGIFKKRRASLIDYK